MAVTAAESAAFNTTWNDARIAPSCADSDCPHRAKDESLILFQPHLLSRIPRGWERAPTNAFTARLKGHKVWKRYDLRSDRPTTTGTAPASEVSGPEDAREESGRAVKRLRVGQELVPRLEQPGADGRSYVGTLWGSSAKNKKRKIAPRRSARCDELPSVLSVGEAVNKHEGEPHGAQRDIIEEELSGRLPQPSDEGGNSAEPIPVQTSAIEHDGKIIDSSMLFKNRPRRLNGPKTKITAQHGKRPVRDGRRATIAGRVGLLRTPCKRPVSPGFRIHPKSVDGKVIRGSSSTMFVHDSVQVTCATETAGENPAAGKRIRNDMDSGAAEEAASPEKQAINTPVKLIPEQDRTSSSGSVTESRGCDVSPTSANVPSNILNVSMSEVQASPSITGPCGEVRLGSRLSDDTDMLKDFLDRVKAKKAAMSVELSEAARPVSPSPPKSPRKILAAVDSNIPSPRRSQDIANRPGTPPGKDMLESSDLDELDDGAIEPVSFRRSERARLPAPQRLTRGTPSLIPVRRPNGPEPVVLQKSVAQELALTTRANTRRNKGRSKPAVVTLLTLAKEPAQLDAPVKGVREGAKQVAWDETLVYHLEGEAQPEERKPKMRRLKGLGTANGTPAANKKEGASAFPYPAGGLGNRSKGRTKA